MSSVVQRPGSELIRGEIGSGRTVGLWFTPDIAKSNVGPLLTIRSDESWVFWILAVDESSREHTVMGSRALLVFGDTGFDTSRC